MRECEALIERVRQVNRTHQQLTLTVDPALAALKAGQSVLALTGVQWNPYLRAQWYPVAAAKETLVVERPMAEAYAPGETVNLLGPVGKPLRFRRTLRTVLLLAYETPPSPLIMAIAPLLANRVGVTLLLLGTAAEYETEHLPPEVEVLKGDAEFNWPNRVTTAGWADQVFAAVPQADEAEAFGRVWALFRELRAEIPENYLWGFYQTPQPCGYGGCAACWLRTRGGVQAVCTDGPAFDLREVGTWR
jgi:NAD(P)H-flavin reductase